MCAEGPADPAGYRAARARCLAARPSRPTTGEGCDDGNLEDGDGCSAGCQQECVGVDDCDDGDPCTGQSCGAGLCAFSEPAGYEGAICTVGELIRTPACGDTVLPSTLAKKMEQAAIRSEAALRKAETSIQAKQVGKLLKRAYRQLVGVQTKAEKLVAKERIRPECGATIVQRATRPRAIISALGGPPS